MPRTKFLWIPALAFVAATLGCSVEMPVAQAPSTSTPPPTPPPNTTTTPMPDSSTAAMPSSDAATAPQTSADPGAATPPMPGAEGMPVEGATTATPAVPDYSVPGSSNQPGSPGTPDSSAPPAENPGSPTTPDYSVPSSEGAGVPPGMPEGTVPSYGQPGVATAPPEKPFEEMTLAERAESCFKKGEETEGFRWLYAHAIASEMDQAAETLDKLRWLPGPKRPSLAARFGVAVKFDAPLDLVALATAMPAVGDPVPGLIRGRKDQPAGGAADTSGAGSNPAKEIPKTAPATLRFFSGDVGAKFLERFETSRTENEWGEVLGEMEGAGSLLAKPNDPFGSEGYAMPSSTPTSETGSDVSNEDRKKLGPSLSLDGGDQISPGIVWLGFDTSASSAARKAAPLGLDCVLLVDVKVLLGRNAPPRNKTKVMATDVASAKVVASTLQLDQFDVYEMRELRPNAKDPVDQAIETLFEALVPLYAMQDMPEISGESALNRARQLIADPPADPLPALAEMRYYLHKGLMDEAQYAIACKNLATEPGVGEKLGSQNEEDRIAAVEALIEAMSGDEEEPSDASGAKSKSDKKKADSERPAEATPTGGAPVAP
jgi:hypothetical protein